MPEQETTDTIMVSIPTETTEGVPAYRGLHWTGTDLPFEAEPWPRDKKRSADAYDVSRKQLRSYARDKPWVWPARPVFFLCDQHADADAFLLSLVASGAVIKTGPDDEDLVLTSSGRAGVFIIGGDVFDKGPDNLRLVRAIGHLIHRGANVKLLAGNHDIRTLVGFSYVGRKEPRFAHLVVRMGRKSTRLLREIHEDHVDPATVPAMSDEEVRELLWPPDSWYDEFPVVEGLIPPARITHELNRIRAKSVELEQAWNDLGLSLPELHAAVMKGRALFQPDGPYGWFFERMQLAYRLGSFLFVHAGVDDNVASIIQDEGIEGLNDRFRAEFEHDLFHLYHGPLGNVFRTKYRDRDRPFTADGVKRMHRAGIYAIVHGHRNILRGQRFAFRNGLLNVECDASVDRGTRAAEGLEGPGGAVTIFQPAGTLAAVSKDYPLVKVLNATKIFPHVTISETATMSKKVQKNEENGSPPETDATTDAPEPRARISFDSPLSKDEAVTYFESIIAGIKKGTICLKQGGESITLKPPKFVDVSVRARSKDSKERIAFEISWRVPSPTDLSITSE